MDWVVDTCVLLDILDELPPFAEAAAEAVDAKAEEGELTVAPITYVELAPAFNGDRAMQDLFLRNVGVNIDFGGNAAAVFTAHKAWYEHILRKRSGTEKKRPHYPKRDGLQGPLSQSDDIQSCFVSVMTNQSQIVKLQMKGTSP